MKHEFVEFIPERLEDGGIYVCVAFSTVVHLCACGCGREVVTPLSPAGWELTYNGETISLYPSIGNWAFPCKAHYWIVRGKVHWARRWSDEQISAVRATDRAAWEHLFDSAAEKEDEATQEPHEKTEASGAHQQEDTGGPEGSLFSKAGDWLVRRWPRR